LGVTKGGHSAILSTSGNQDCHVILRGGQKPNFDAASVEVVSQEIIRAGLEPRLMIDCSHGNSSKNHENQIPVSRNIADQIAAGETRIVGVMAESNLVAGRQDLVPGQALVYGQSVTDACIGWDDTVTMLETLANALKARRAR
jgi:3-deoxy-7-phosphoheptulonate synthase